MQQRPNTNSESGQTLIFSILFFTVLIGFAALVIDGGGYLLERRNMQGTADAAAMAGVKELPGSELQADLAATDYAEVRNTDSANVDDITVTGSNTIKVDVDKVVAGPFHSFFGMAAPTIRATATARASQVAAMGKMLPFGLMEGGYDVGVQTNFISSGSSRKGLLYPDVEPACNPSQGGNDDRNLISTAQNGGTDACPMNLGETMESKPGFTSGNIKPGFEARIPSDDNDAIDEVFSYDASTDRYSITLKDSPRVGVIPIVENEDGTLEWENTGSKVIRITGYVLVYIGKTDGDTGPANKRYPDEYPAYTDGGKSVWMTPLLTILPAQLGDYMSNVTYSEEWDPDNPDSPVAYRLIQ